jgi:hypothetical protein
VGSLWCNSKIPIGNLFSKNIYALESSFKALLESLKLKEIQISIYFTENKQLGFLQKKTRFFRVPKISKF